MPVWPSRAEAEYRVYSKHHTHIKAIVTLQSVIEVGKQGGDTEGW